MFAWMSNRRSVQAKFFKIFHFFCCVFKINSVNRTERTFINVSHHFHIQLIIQNHGRQRS